MDAINRFGKTMYSELLPNYMAQATNNQFYRFNMSLPQFEKNGTFNVDYRLTKNP